jgi:hypothetical protein
MTATPPERGSVEPEQLTISYTENDDGWVTAQIVEFPAAISQGPTRRDAWINVLDALHDLTHEPTLAERVAFTADARLAEARQLLTELAELRDRFIGALERDRTTVR